MAKYTVGIIFLYLFISVPEFKSKLNDSDMLEWAEVHGNFYGTSRQFVTYTCDSGTDILLDIDVQGAFQVKKKLPNAILIFIMPPSLDELKNRLVGRGSDSGSVIDKRLINAEREIQEKDRYDHIIVNDDLEKAASDFISIITTHRNR